MTNLICLPPDMRGVTHSPMHNLQLSVVEDRMERNGMCVYVFWGLAGIMRGKPVVWGVRGALVHICANINCNYEKRGTGDTHTCKPLVLGDAK
eukprot:13196711-Ditylum_brightwellii.AAC.1